MRIAYACFWDAFVRDGVATKINTQTAAWREAGHEVEVLCVSPAPRPGAKQVLRATVFPFGGLAGRVAATVRMLRATARAHPDAIYLRYDHFLPTPGRLLRSLPSVVEVNGPVGPAPTGRNRVVQAYSRLNERTIYRSASGFVCVGYTLARRLEPLGKPTVVVTNGVDLDVREVLPPPENERLGFVLLAGAQTEWHGVDKVLDMATAMPDCDFTLIGVEESQLPAAPSDNVRSFGLLPREEYEPLLAQADVAIGPIAMDRVGRYENSSLKVPEYLAYGLPVIIGYEETDFIGSEAWYLLRLPATPSNVHDHLKEIRAFADRVRGRRVPREEVGELIGARAKEEKRLAFITRVASA